ncbi:MAG: DUF3180 domain-containing protein [Propionibacteriales bacterium]|nr:DUF3180 domain-containing protein [Propionibacteriales bacterium]
MADQPGQSKGTIGPTRINTLVASFVLGAAAGYTLVPVSEWLNGTAPTIEWSSVAVLVVIAAVLLALAYSTYRIVHRDRARMEPQRAVNFLMLAKASALMGALVAGGYGGFGAQFLDQLEIALPRERVIRSVASAVASVAIVICALLLERACRVPRDPDE